MRKWIDIPPVWLVACLGLAWWQAKAWTMGLSFGPVWADLLGGLLVGAGVLTMLLAVAEMRRHQTTVMPHDEAAHLVTSGVFKWSRNPIYVGDVMMLSGFVLYWDAVLSLVLVPVFVWLIEKRFIETEECRLKRKFVAKYEIYSQQTRRWL